MARVCTRCGGELQENDIFCGKCGQLAEGRTPPPNAWANVGPVLSAMPQKKKGKGCLTAFLIFLLIIAALVAAAYFYFRSSFSVSVPRESKTPAATESSSGGGISISWDDLFSATSSSSSPAPEETSAPAETYTSIENPFDDVDEGKYYYEAALWAYEKGLTGGTSFLPTMECTRGQFITMLWRMDGAPEYPADEAVFDDVETTDYFYSATVWANMVGLTNAASGARFLPNDPITRAQAATFLYRILGYDPYIVNPFSDVKESDYFYKPALWALDAGIVGSSDTFNPNGVCDRGNAVTFIYRACRNYY